MNKSEYFDAHAAMIHFMQSAKTSEDHVDEKMVDITAMAMRSKLSAARDKGRHGWWDPEQCSIGSLKRLLVEHIEKGDMIDVMNFAGMIFVREIQERQQPNIKYPATSVCYWPSGPVFCCDRHAKMLDAMARQMCCYAPIATLALETAECSNCASEAKQGDQIR